MRRAKEDVHWGCVSVGTLKLGYPFVGGLRLPKVLKNMI
jgi:hypothetical protein